MDKIDIDKLQDDNIKEILSFSKIKASENLKYRIMQQIETESVFSAKKSESMSIVPLIRNFLLKFGIMYVFVVLAAIGVYFMGGIEFLSSPVFFAPVIMISLVCSVFWMISFFDDKRHIKHQAS